MRGYLKKLFLDWALSIRLAFRSLQTNLMRTSLSLLGVSIGIFSVSAIYTGVDSLNVFLLNSLDKFGNNTLFVDRFNYQNMGKADWDEIRKKKAPSYHEFLYLKSKLPGNLYRAINFRMYVPSVPVKFEREQVRAVLTADTYRVADIMHFDLAQGRFYNSMEDEKGLPVAVIGASVAEALFGDGNAVGKEIKMLGKKIKVVGVLKKEGGLIKINPSDNRVFVPYSFVRKFYPAEKDFFVTIMVAPKDEKHVNELKQQIIFLLRKARRLKPGMPDNFYVNNIDFLKDAVEKSMKILSLSGWILGGFSLLVGAFGIANIMFVSVKERTREIGIQKALGAKRRIILWEFLSESVLLSLIGGLLGFGILYVAVLIFEKTVHGFDLVISLRTVSIMAAVAVSIGILAGIWPAYRASELNPIDAIRK
jgi:putative ABC transport system permease protein